MSHPIYYHNIGGGVSDYLAITGGSSTTPQIAVTANTEGLSRSLDAAGRAIRHLAMAIEKPQEPDWESRVWGLTRDLVIRMADRCQDGLMTPDQLGELATQMAAAAAGRCHDFVEQARGGEEARKLKAFIEEFIMPPKEKPKQ